MSPRAQLVKEYVIFCSAEEICCFMDPILYCMAAVNYGWRALCFSSLSVAVCRSRTAVAKIERSAAGNVMIGPMWLTFRRVPKEQCSTL